MLNLAAILPAFNFKFNDAEIPNVCGLNIISTSFISVVYTFYQKEQRYKDLPNNEQQGEEKKFFYCMYLILGKSVVRTFSISDISVHRIN